MKWPYSRRASYLALSSMVKVFYCVSVKCESHTKYSETKKQLGRKRVGVMYVKCTGIRIHIV